MIIRWFCNRTRSPSNLVGGEGDGGLAADLVHDAGDGKGIGQGVVAGLKGAVFNNVDELFELAEVLIRIARNGDVLLCRPA